MPTNVIKEHIEITPATELLRLWIPDSEIVLAFQPPDVREFTEFSIA